MKISLKRKERVQKAVALMAPNLVSFMLTDLTWRLAKKNLSYGAAVNYLEERMAHLSSKDLQTMWASYFDLSLRKNLYKEIWLLAKEVHDSKLSALTVSDFYREILHVFNIGEVLKQPK